MGRALLFPTPPLPKGDPLLTAEEIREKLRHKVSVRWVIRNVPNRLKLGHRSEPLWYESDVDRWITQRRTKSA